MTTTHPQTIRPGFGVPDLPTTGPDRSAFLRPLCGAERGYNTLGGALVTKTADGIPLSRIWEEQQATVALFNEQRSRIASLLSFPTTVSAEPVAQTLESESFERASEFGEPTGIATAAKPLLVGFDLDDWDRSTRFTWKALRAYTSQQVQGIFNLALAADNKLVNGTILDRLFDPRERVNDEGNRVFGLWNGADGLGPLPYLGRAFPTTTNHYLASGAPVIDSGDIEDLIDMVSVKGYRTGNGTQLLILANPAESRRIQGFQRDIPSRAPFGSETTGPLPLHSFIPSATAPAYLTDQTVIGQVAPGEYGGLPVLGSYGPAWLIESEFIPAGYVTVVATGGPGSSQNPIGLREFPAPEYRGLRQIPGRDTRYPLVESYFARSFGTGVRYRSAAACLQVTTGSTYTPPVIPK
ncbi:hypothetical protein ACFULT_25565 [Rhodococcus sp. NPDC057297]|uniref:hypothetical protein n=1 Tax=Rhodococcus sp. NPDC057297 TaxID=3346090 RepID=UPI0036455D16